MNRYHMIAALLAASALATPGFAQTAPEPQDVPADAVPDASDEAADAAIASAQPVDEAAAQLQLLTEQVAALQDQIDGLKSSMVKTTPSWKGAPLFEDKDAGWSFKPRGRIMYDVGYVENPGDDIVTRNLGYNSRVRRIRLGAEGTIPGGFGYKFEMDYANGSVGFGDAILTYQPKGKPWSLTVGNHETFNGLDQISSSRFLSFLERGAFNDAFVNTRRIGISGGLVNKAGDLRFNAGLFAAHSIDGGFDNDGWIGASRVTYSPLMGANQLHFGANFQHRKFQSNNGATASNSVGAPSTNQLARYRARPFTQTTDVRFVDTGNFAAKSDNIIGLEAGGIFKSLHVVAEGQWVRTNAYEAGDTFASTDPLDLFTSATAVTPTGNPSFWGGYAEVGYYLTGETRGYKNGAWDRTKVLKPFSKGGWGAVQLNARVDYLDLDDNDLKDGLTNNFTTGATSLASTTTRLGRGGKQLGLLGGLVWIPEDYFRVYLQYARANITGGPFAATVESGSTKPVDERKYGVDTVAARASIDF